MKNGFPRKTRWHLNLASMSTEGVPQISGKGSRGNLLSVLACDFWGKVVKDLEGKDIMKLEETLRIFVSILCLLFFN